MLDLSYYSESDTFEFIAEDIQDIITNSIAPSEITWFYVQDAETYDLIPSDHLLENVTSILVIVREKDNNLYWRYAIVLNNGIKLKRT